MIEHNSYKIYPKAIRAFINENYDLKTISFGNIENNVKAILQKLNIEHLIDCKWDVDSLYFFDKKNISKTNNKPSDFNDYEPFKFIFTSLSENYSTKEFELAIKKLESDFIYRYQNNLDAEYSKELKKEALKKKRQKIFFYTAAGFLILLLIVSVLYIKHIQSTKYS